MCRVATSDAACELTTRSSWETFSIFDRYAREHIVCGFIGHLAPHAARVWIPCHLVFRRQFSFLPGLQELLEPWERPRCLFLNAILHKCPEFPHFQCICSRGLIVLHAMDENMLADELQREPTRYTHRYQFLPHLGPYKAAKKPIDLIHVDLEIRAWVNMRYSSSTLESLGKANIQGHDPISLRPGI